MANLGRYQVHLMFCLEKFHRNLTKLVLTQCDINQIILTTLIVWYCHINLRLESTKLETSLWPQSLTGNDVYLWWEQQYCLSQTRNFWLLYVLFHFHFHFTCKLPEYIVITISLYLCIMLF